MTGFKKIWVALLAVAACFFIVLPAQAAQEWQQVYNHIDQMLTQAQQQYDSGDQEGAKQTINDSYYGVYEKDGLEKAIRSAIASKNANLTEYQYSKLKRAVRDNAGSDQVTQEREKLLEMIQADVHRLENKAMGGGRWASFWPAFLILLREGMEAILMLVAVLAYLSKSGNKKYLGTVYNWATAGVVASFATAYVFSAVLGKFEGGASQELIEGCTALFAVAVLLGMSLWMNGKANAEAWKHYVEGMVQQSISTGRATALGFASFLAVYREGAEVILFYQALFNNATGDTEMIWFGFGAGCVVLAIIFGVIQMGLLRIPLRPFFIVTSTLMFLMAVAFAGSGVSELQEAQVVSQTVINADWLPSIDLLGLYPTVETLTTQLVLLLLGVGTYFMRKHKEKAAA